MISIKYLNKIFADFAANNTMINSYDSGFIFDINPEPEINYPLLFVELPSAVIDNSINYDFTIYAIDRLKEDDSNLLDVHNSALKIVSDFRTYLRKNQELSSLLFVEDESPVDFFAHKYSDYTAGAKMEIKVKVLNNELLCDIPLNNFDFGEYINWNINYSSSTSNNVVYTFSAGTGLSVTNNANNITYTYTGNTSSGSSLNLIAGENITLTSTGSSTTINSVLKYFTGGTGSGSIVTTSPAITSFANGNNAVSIGVNNSANTAYSLCLGGQSNLINNTYSIRSIILGGVSNRIFTTNSAAKHNAIINSYNSQIKGSTFLSSINSGIGNKIASGQYSNINGGRFNYINGEASSYITTSTIVNGASNIITGSSSTILNGSGNVVGGGSLIGGGGLNYCTAPQSVILHGVGNRAIGSSSVYSLIGTGLNNTINDTGTALCNSIINGYSNIITGKFSTIINGYANTINSNYGLISGKSNTINSGHTYATVFGNGLQSIKSNTVHVPNLSIDRGIFLKPFEITEDTTIEADDYNYIIVNSESAVNISLNASYLDGYTLVIKDGSGNGNISVNYEGGIDGDTDLLLSRPYSCAILTYQLSNDKFFITSLYSI